MARTQRNKRYPKYVRSPIYHSIKRAAQNSDVEANKPTRGRAGYRSPLRFREASYEGFLESYPTFHGSKSQAPIELIMKKQRDRLEKYKKSLLQGR